MPFNVINKPAHRLDAFEKVTGKAKFTGDISFRGMLYGGVLHTKYPSAKIRFINLENAREVKGVKTILSAHDIPNNEFGKVRKDQQVLAKKRTYYIGDAIILVAGTTKEVVRKALEQIHIEYEELPGVFDPVASSEPGAMIVHPEWKSNEVAHHIVTKGDVNQGFRDAEVVIEREYTTPFIEHAYLEPEAVIAVPSSDSEITIYGSTAHPFVCRDTVATILGLPIENVRVIQTHLGGAFGGKDENMSVLAARATILALKTGRPVKIVYTREESFIESYKRHPYRMKYKIGATSKGKLTAEAITIIADSGSYVGQTPYVTWRSVVHATGPYNIPNVKVKISGFYTNNVYTGAMRGYGSPQIVFAHETLMDELAVELGLNPLSFRLLNIYRDNSVTACGQRLNNHTVSLEEIIKKATNRADFVRKYREYSTFEDGDIRRGIGIAVSYRGCGLGGEATDRASVRLCVDADGHVNIYCGLAENGQGLETVLRQIVAEELGININKVRYIPIDTTIVPESGPTVASRSTLVGGNAAIQAAREVKEKLSSIAAQILGCNEDTLSIEDTYFYSCEKCRKTLSVEDAAIYAGSHGIEISGLGNFQVTGISWDTVTGQGSPHLTYVYGCQIAEVEVDIGTGEIRCLNVIAAHDVGRAINTVGTMGQISGGVAMGLGYALTEELNIVDGFIKETNFDHYLIPTAQDVPRIIPIIIENPDPNGPFGAKSVGEPTTELTAAAIGNAVFHACGKRIRDLPINLERTLLGHHLQKHLPKRE